MFSKAHDSGQSPQEFVTEMRRKNQLIMGIGHRCVVVIAMPPCPIAQRVVDAVNACRVKSLTNPDKRVTIVKDYAKANFVATPVLDFALEVLWPDASKHMTPA